MTDLDARYGRTPTSRRRIGVWIAAGALVLATAVWFIWANPIGIGGSSMSWRDTGYTIVSDAEVEVRWEMTADDGTATQCAIYALNESYGVVGWKIVDLPPSDVYIRQFTEPLRTSERATTGLAYRCWIA